MEYIACPSEHTLHSKNFPVRTPLFSLLFLPLIEHTKIFIFKPYNLIIPFSLILALVTSTVCESASDITPSPMPKATTSLAPCPHLLREK